MRITFLLTQDLNSPSSLGRFFPLAKELAKLNYQIQILTLHSNYKTQGIKKEILAGVKIHYLGQMQVLKIGNDKVYFRPFRFLYLMMIASIKFILYALFGNYDVLYIGKPHPMNGLGGLVGKYVRKKKIIVDCDDFESSVNRFAFQWQQKIVTYFENRLPLSADLVNTNTMFSLNRLKQLGVPEDKLYLLPNGIDRKRFAIQDKFKSEELKAKYALHGKIVIGYVGTIALTSHPIEQLLEAFSLLVDQHPEIHLLLIGGGEDIQFVKQRINELTLSEYVTLVGRINPEDIGQYYKLCDITVDPVLNNDVAKARLPVKMFESWATEVPFVTSDIGDRKKYLTNPMAGVCASDVTPNDLASAISKIIMDSELRNEIIANGITKAEQFYWDNITKKYDKFLKENI